MLRWPGNFLHFLWLVLVLVVLGLIYLFGRIATLVMVQPRRARSGAGRSAWG